MEKLLTKLKDIKGVKAVRNRSGTLKIELFSRPVANAEAKEISGDLRSIGQKITNTLNNSSEISSWNWIQKPEKKYSKTSVKTEKVSDRKPVGHEPDYYTLSIQG